MRKMFYFVVAVIWRELLLQPSLTLPEDMSSMDLARLIFRSNDIMPERQVAYHLTYSHCSETGSCRDRSVSPGSSTLMSSTLTCPVADVQLEPLTR